MKIKILKDEDQGRTRSLKQAVLKLSSHLASEEQSMWEDLNFKLHNTEVALDFIYFCILYDL